MSVRAGALALVTSDKIRDLGRQIDNVKKFCTLKDVPLCDTVNTNSLELLMKFDLVCINDVTKKHDRISSGDHPVNKELFNELQ